MPGKIVNSSELGRVFGITYQTVQYWIDDGMPWVTKPDGEKTGARGWSFDCGEVLKFKVDQAKKQARLEASRMSDLDSAKARKTEAEAQLAELNLATKLGKTVSIDDVVHVVAAHVGSARARLLSMPAALAPLLAVDDTGAGCQSILEAGIREALEELSEGGFAGAGDFEVVEDEPEGVRQLHSGDADEGSAGMGSSSEADDF